MAGEIAQALVRLAKAEERESTPQAEDPEIVKAQEREAVQAEGPAGAIAHPRHAIRMATSSIFTKQFLAGNRITTTSKDITLTESHD